MKEVVDAIPIGFFEDDGRTPGDGRDPVEAVRLAAFTLQSCGFRCRSISPPRAFEEVRQRWWEFFGTAGGMMPETRSAAAVNQS